MRFQHWTGLAFVLFFLGACTGGLLVVEDAGLDGGGGADGGTP